MNLENKVLRKPFPRRSIKRTTPTSRTEGPISLAQPPSEAGQHAIDIALHRISSASQLGILILAVFGYFYTVVPVYQKSLLDEDIAKKVIELREMEARVTKTEQILADRELEFNALSHKIIKLRDAAKVAQQKLSRSQLEIGQLKGTVQSQYSELRPRLLGEFLSLARSRCATIEARKSTFSDCIEHDVLSSQELSPLSKADRTSLARISRTKGTEIDRSLMEAQSQIALKSSIEKQKIEGAQAICDQGKSSADYKDRMKKISIDYKCSISMIEAQSSNNRLLVERISLPGRIITPYLTDIVNELLATR